MMDGNEWQLMAMDLKEWQPDAILVSPTGSICLRLTTFPGCEIRRPGRFMSRSFSGTGRNFWKALCCRPYQVMSSLPQSPLVFVKVVPSEKRNTPSSSLNGWICGDDGESLCERVTWHRKFSFSIRMWPKNLCGARTDLNLHIIKSNPEVVHCVRIQRRVEKIKHFSCLRRSQETA